jgi:hypothetical protein
MNEENVIELGLLVLPKHRWEIAHLQELYEKAKEIDAEYIEFDTTDAISQFFTATLYRRKSVAEKIEELKHELHIL